METEPTPRHSAAADLVTLQELAQRTGMNVGWFYERSRFDGLPGQHRFGGSIRVHLPTFLAAAKAGALGGRFAQKPVPNRWDAPDAA